MADRGRRGRGYARKENLQSPKYFPRSSRPEIRRPGESGDLPFLGTGRGVQRVGISDADAAANLSKPFDRLKIQSTVGDDGSGGSSASGASGSGGDAGSTIITASGRGSSRGRKILSADIFVTKPQHVTNKKGESGKRITLKANYFKLLKTTNWSIQQYRVDFVPEEERTVVRKGLLKLHKKKLGSYIFDGTLIYTCTRLPEKMVLTSMRQSDQEHIMITIRLVSEIREGDTNFIQFFNIIMRKCLECLKLQQVGRDYYDSRNKVVLPEYRLELWPGYITSIRQHENDILMCASVTYKVMRLDTLLDILNVHFYQNKETYRENFAKAVIGTVVLTHYNNNTYRIEDVDFQTTPAHSFKLKTGQEITYVQYYKKKYDINIINLKQPMLVTRSKKKVRQAELEEMVYLVPELCCATGLTDSMRDNYKLMSTLSTHTRLNPAKRIEKLLNFHKRLSSEPSVTQELSEWNLKLDNKLFDVPARVLNAENIMFGGDIGITSISCNWSKDMQNKRCFIPKKLNDWILVVTDRDKHAIQNFVDVLKRVSKGVDFFVDQPSIYTIRDDRPGTYNETLEYILSKKTPQLIFCVVSNNRSDRYSAIKKKCCVDRPTASQVCVFKTLTHKNIMSIATKIAIQINCKLGGAPWYVHIPMDGSMIVGFDVCHDTTSKGKDFGATIASLDKNMTKYFSAVDSHADGNELSTDIAKNICKAAQQFRKINKILPSRIIIYRDGVGEGQVPQVMEQEVIQIQQELNSLYGNPNQYKMAFIIVTKRLNTRLFYNNHNPPAGAVVDDYITSPIKYDFFLVSQQVREGTITPTSYSVIYDNLSLTPDRMQRLTYKLTHMYFNSTNTVRVPAPCHYAHKLAFLVSRFIHQSPDSKLQDTLYFL